MGRRPVAGALGARDSVVGRNAWGPFAIDTGTGDVLSSLDLAFLGALEPGNSRWGLIDGRFLPFRSIPEPRQPIAQARTTHLDPSETHMTERNKRVSGVLATACLACAMAAPSDPCGADPGSERLPELGGTPATPAASSDGPSAADLERIAQISSNPLGAAWMLWLQNDTSEIRGDLVPGGQTLNTTRFQPVMSFPIDVSDQEWNLIVRPVIQYQSVPLDSQVGRLFGTSPETIVADPDLGQIAGSAWDDRTNGFGDTALLTLLGPNRLDGFIWGVGASQIFPTAEEDVLGQGKWQAGPAVLFARLAPKPGGFNVGALAQHWWSYAGDSDRDATSHTDIQYFINYRLSGTELVGMSPNIRIDWTQDAGNQLTLPIGLGYSNVVKLGPLPVRIALEAQYSVIAPDNVGSDWNVRFLFIPVIPNPFGR